jgi:4-amino-4-deoxy-L-arabinose transferase-like glycosyltransferase
MKHTYRLEFLGALLLAFALRVYALDAQSLWNDEGTSVALALRSIEAIIVGAARDIHPPLYYLLLHFWMPFVGTTEYTVRFLSVIGGVLTIAVVLRIAYSVFGERVGIVAAFLTALSPFQVYYSQEARMYIWVTLWSALSVCAFIQVSGFKFQVEQSAIGNQRSAVSGQQSAVIGHRSSVSAWLAYIVATLAALYTQYVGAFIVLAENLAFAIGWLGILRNTQYATRSLALWLIGQLVIGSLFLPWFLFAGGQLATWPSISEPLDLPTLVWRVLNVFSVGLTLEDELATITSILFGVLFVLGCLRTAVPLSYCPTVPLLLWTLVPVAAVYIVSLSRPAYNPKFLLLATPAFYILVARGLSAVFSFQFSVFSLHASRITLSRSLALSLFLIILISNLQSLISYYHNPRYARDDYRTIVHWIDTNERAGDGMLINAPGQIDVVRYYWRGNQTLFLLPRMRPPDPTATRADVDEMLGKTRRLFAIYWATDQSDPARIVETRLAERAFKARDEWHGDVRLALYGIAPSAREAPRILNARFNTMLLHGYQLDTRDARAGDVLTLTLYWRVEQTPNARYKVFVHLLDADARVIAQRDGEPFADLRPTTTWRVGETIVDNYGVFIEPSTPPGEYRIAIGVYRADDGARLRVGESDHLILGNVSVK